MKNTKRILSSLLALLTVSAVFASCSSGSADTTDTTQSDTSADTTTVAETEKQYIPDLPDEDFGGREIKLLTWEYGTTKITDFSAYELNGDQLNDAIFTRNSAVEERYNVDIVLDERVRLDSQGIASTSIMAGEDIWGILNIGASNIVALSKSAYVYDLLTLDYLDVHAEWWDQRCVDEMSILGKLFLLMGDINIYDDSETVGLIFNKELAQSYNLGNLYSFVNDGTWTIDKMYSLAETVSEDLNGDGVMDSNDRWGVFGEKSDIYYHLAGAGINIAEKDENDLPYLSLNNDRTVDVLDKAHSYLTNKNNVVLAHNWAHLANTSVFVDVIIPMFKNSQGLFYFTAVGNTYKNLRDMEPEYGILPTPKYDEAQDEYYNSLSAGWATAVSIPISCADPDFAAFILEALAAESVLTLSKTYKEIIFNNKGLRDEESVEMADLIFHTRVFDIGSIYGWGNIGNMISGLVDSNTVDFASKYASLEKSALTALEDTIELYESIE